MTAVTISSRQFSLDANRAKEAARNGPVFIVDDGRPAHVLMTIELYERLVGKREGTPTLADLLAMPGTEDIDFDPPQLQGPITKAADLS